MEFNNIWQIVFLAFLLCCSAFFSASETALMSLSKIRIRHMVEEKVNKAETIHRIIEKPDRLLGTILVGNNVVNIGASSLATALAIDFFGSGGVGIATAVMTVLVLIFGEITPKSLAAQNSEKVSLKVIKAISLIIKLLFPVVTLFTYITNVVIKILGGKTNKEQPFVTEEELKTIVSVSHEEGILEEEEKQMIHKVFQFGDLRVKDIMIQRPDVVALDMEIAYDQLKEIIMDEQFSRYPVYKDHFDDIIGILNVKDLLFNDGKEEFNIRKFIREPYFSYEFKKIAEVFEEMKKNKIHMAIVLDEYGSVIGIITIEDLIEEIVGDIEDEYDENEEDIEVIKEDEYIVNGSTRIEIVNEMIGTNLESEDFDSIGGFIIGVLGRFPVSGEKLEFRNTKFIVEDIEKNRIRKIRILT